MTSTYDSQAPSRRDFLRGLSATALVASGCSTVSERPPNILFLLTDDQRADALGCAGNPIIQTSNVDRLAEQGVLFENNFVTTSICAVSRASFFTGQYARTHGIHGFGVSLTAEQHAASYPAQVRAAGYRTGFIGKYGVGRELPEGQFDYFKGFAGQGRYFNEVDGRQVHLTEMMGDRRSSSLTAAQMKRRSACRSASSRRTSKTVKRPISSTIRRMTVSMRT